ncbi:putative toxin-antitoxin system toxin component, PIN family [Candidatus Gottesmanbacteria bacterium]|nr:putative toxin-antitoxin system toxin component, PIN family [Candidatus Gottesmanbacteria bacterium]
MKSLPTENPRKKVVVDTAVLISATIVDGAYRKLIRKLLQADFELCIPQEVINEYYEVIQRPKFKKYEPLFTEIFEELKKSSIILPIAKTYKHKLVSFPEDEGIINCCVENNIAYLVTHDKEIIGKYNGLEVIFAQDFYSQFLTN